jgi:hypothetical protein
MEVGGRATQEAKAEVDQYEPKEGGGTITRM